jgi:hypothetical protein
MLIEESLAARAALQREALRIQREQAGQLAVEDAAQTAAREALLARGVRETALALLGSLIGVKDTIRALVARLGEGAGQIALEEIPIVVKQTTAAVREVAAIAAQAIEVERVRIGDPALVIGVKSFEPDRPLPELERELAAEVAAAERALARSRARAEAESDGGDDLN